MDFVRKVANSNILASVIDIPESLKNKKVEILIFLYEDEHVETIINQKPKRVRGFLEKYKNKELLAPENDVWTKAAEDKY